LRGAGGRVKIDVVVIDLDVRALGAIDVRALRTIYGGAHGAWATPMVAATLLGEGWTSLALLPLLAWSRTRRFAVLLAAATLTQAVLVKTLKQAFGRVRPWIALGLPEPIRSPHDPSFPSGHAAGCFCVAAFLALALPAAWPDRRGLAWSLVALAGALAVLIALSRVYLGAHFPADVLAGALLGALVGALAGGVYARERSGVERVAKRG
jgi:undecaprenyl-diphosphatase